MSPMETAMRRLPTSARGGRLLMLNWAGPGAATSVQKNTTGIVVFN